MYFFVLLAVHACHPQGVETLEVVEVVRLIERVSGAVVVEVVVLDARNHVHGVRNVVSLTPRNAITQVACCEVPLSGFNQKAKFYESMTLRNFSFSPLINLL